LLKMMVTDRRELKFLINYSTYKKMLEYVKPFTQKDIFFDASGKYLVNSLYYDSPGNKFYWDKIEGEKIRKKVRIRSHFKDSGELARTAIEIKMKNNLNVFKEKAIMSFDDAVSLIENSSVDDIVKKNFSASQKRAIDEAIFLKHKYDIKPKILICYERQAFFDKYNPRTRITFDFNIKYRTIDLTTEKTEMENFTIEPNIIVLEIKYNGHMPYWISSMIQNFDLNLTTFSKYCESVNSSLQNKDF